MHGLLRPSTWPPTSGPAGRHLSSPGSGAPDQQGRNWTLYYQVYKLRRLPGSPPCGPECMEELVGDMVFSLKNCLRQKEGHPPEELEESRLADAWPLQSNTPRRRMRGTSAERDLIKVREAHQRALVTTAALEEKIERLSQSITIGQLGAHIHSQSCDCQKRRSQGSSRRCQQTALPIPLSSALPSGAQEPGRTKGLKSLLTWGHHQSWDQTWTVFSRSWPAMQGKIAGMIPPQNPQQRNIGDG